MGTALVLIVLAGAVYAAIHSVYKNRKKGCNGSCGSCGGSCHH